MREDGIIYVLTKAFAEVEGLSGKVWEDFIVELDASGRAIRKLSIITALRDGGQQQILEELRQYQREANEMLAEDPLHTNSLEWLDGKHAKKLEAFARGNLLISLPMVHRVAVVDLDAGRVIWSIKRKFRFQHHPTMLENGNILLFDNKGLEGERSRVVEIDPVSGEEVWSHGGAESEAFYSACCGLVYRLENDNALVVDSKRGRAFEIVEHHQIVWEFRSPHRVGDNVAILNDLIRVPLNASTKGEKFRESGTPYPDSTLKLGAAGAGEAAEELRRSLGPDRLRGRWRHDSDIMQEHPKAGQAIRRKPLPPQPRRWGRHPTSDQG